ncbi:MAG: EAL domain-containing protein, partial [Actinomycetota bacterium]|nr:EAL domain-containing protein [Actinomycetota bacterium]
GVDGGGGGGGNGGRAGGGAALPAVEAALDTLAARSEQNRRSLVSAAVVAQSADLTVVLGADGLIASASPAAATMLGRPAEWLRGRPLAGLVHADDRPALDDLRSPVAPAGERASVELRLSHLRGHWVPTEVSAIDLRHDPAVQAVALNIRDVSVRKGHEEELVRRALHDPLTGLANRALFREHVEHALARLRRSPARPHAVLFIDLDGFKTVNDSLGHAAGDEVLLEVAGRLRRSMRPGDTAARLGGDEFAVLLENTTEADTVALAQRILQVLPAPVVVQGKEVVLSGSIGIALSEPGQDADELLRNADVAMYTAKSDGKRRHRLFRPEMHHAVLHRLDLEAELRRAIDRDELLPAYQPVVDLATGAVTGMEALVRWHHPRRGVLFPSNFIAVAEETGLVRPMGQAVLQRACHQTAAWQRRIPAGPALHLCVNASVRQIEDPGFYDEVARALAESGLPGSSLTLEITESLFMGDLRETVHKLRRLKELELSLAVDDFGTGYSSLSYLRSLPLDVLKIDKSFVAGVTHGPEQSAVARAVVKLARTFSLETVAEGIEHPEQAAELLRIGVHLGQGHWFSPPVGATEMEALLAGRRPLGAVEPDGAAEQGGARSPSAPR